MFVWLLVCGVPAVLAGAAVLTVEGIRRPVFFNWANASRRTPAAVGAAFEDLRIKSADGPPLAGWWVGHPRAEGRTVVMLHGIHDSKASMVGRLEVLRQARPVNVCIMDLRAHGDSGGSELTYGLRESADLSAVLAHLAQRPDVDAKRLVVLGTSLGAAIALRSAPTEARIAGVIAEAPFVDLVTAVRERFVAFHVPRFCFGAVRLWFPRQTGWRMEDVDLRDPVAKMRCPVLFLHGDADDETPAAHSQELHRLCGSTDKKLVMVPEGSHVDLHRVAPDLWKKEIGGFLDRVWGK